MSNFERAKKVVKQINEGQWVAVYNDHTNSVNTIERNGVSIWVCNSSFFCEVFEPKSFDAFGLFFRHWVWFSAQKIRRQEAKQAKSKKIKNIEELLS